MYISGWKWIACNFNIQITLLSNAIGPLKNNCRPHYALVVKIDISLPWNLASSRRSVSQGATQKTVHCFWRCAQTNWTLGRGYLKLGNESLVFTVILGNIQIQNVKRIRKTWTLKITQMTVTLSLCPSQKSVRSVIEISLFDYARCLAFTCSTYIVTESKSVDQSMADRMWKTMKTIHGFTCV